MLLVKRHFKRRIGGGRSPNAIVICSCRPHSTANVRTGDCCIMSMEEGEPPRTIPRTRGTHIYDRKRSLRPAFSVTDNVVDVSGDSQTGVTLSARVVVMKALSD